MEQNSARGLASSAAQPLNLPTASGSRRAADRLVVVFDAPQACPYLEGRVARMPLEYPRRSLSPEDVDELLDQGYRRSGSMLYRTRCPSCQACIPTRLDVRQFRPSRSMKRIVNRANRELELVWGPPVADLSRLRLFNAHRAERDLSQSGPVELDDYHEFLVSSCVETLELSVWLDGTLIGVAIVDRGQHSLNAMYTFFDPNLGRYCVGTLAVLKQVQYARETGRDYVYLGLYVADNSHLNYKARFRPQQRRIDGAWRWIDAECGSMQNNAAPV